MIRVGRERNSIGLIPRKINSAYGWRMDKARIHQLSTHRPVCYTSFMQDRIAIDPEIHFGKPCVAGTRIPVQSVLELIREGLGFDQITRDYYPDLQPDDL